MRRLTAIAKQAAISRRASQANLTIIVAHNLYQQPGGEDEVFRAEAALLEARGQRVVRYTLNNSSISTLGRGTLVKATLWNSAVHRELRQLLHRESPHVVHFHNTFPLMSPAAYFAARSVGVPVVQTLHNYRLLCPNGLLYRNARPCELCIGKSIAWPAIVHSCYRQSRAASAVTAAMLGLHRTLRTWTKAVDIYIALTEFSRQKYIKGGLPADRIIVKPNCLANDPGVGDHAGGFALFVGRLAEGKGVHTLVRAWSHLRRPIPLKIVGDGPLRGTSANVSPNIEWLGFLPNDRVAALMKEAVFLIFPSEWYEVFPVTILEAFAAGLPVIASGHGALAEIVLDGQTGRHFRPGDEQDLVTVVEWACDHAEEMAAMGKRARAEFEAKYTSERNYDMLLRIYRAASGRLHGALAER